MAVRHSGSQGPGLRRGRRIALAALVLSALTASSPAGADTVVSTSGVTGDHHLVDVGSTPGAVCTYDPASRAISRIRARVPVALAVDRTAVADTQDVAIRARAQELITRANGSKRWEDRRIGQLVRLPATDAASPFTGWTEFLVGDGDWRIQWDITWFGVANPSRVTGRAIRQVDHYGLLLGQQVRVAGHQDSCPASIAGMPAKRITHGPRSLPTVALTFDMGSGSGGGLVNWLVDHGIHATIFATGVAGTSTASGRAVMRLVGDHRDLLDIGNHSWDHPNFAKLTPEEIADQLDRMDAAVSPLAGGTTKPLFRPPYGIAHRPEKNAVGAAGWGLDVIWDVPTDDYLPVGQGGPTASELLDEVLATVQNGSIVVLHVDGPHTLEALPSIVAALDDLGLEPVRLSDLLGLQG
ncbi:MAG: peptidoglycan-N-acetylglucosamine deacetylase [Chloroflexota bacterium]|jgi:peptidoglycan/xylan/chitin deacetylase (PgdA/CDA1 family)|nr:peptidoglycan-N-acetylglucosamine deacetylase [Chloroflexota bacterium]